MKTADEEVTKSGRVVSSGWQRCRIVQRSDASEKFASGAVQVKYFDEKEIIEYDIENFLANAHPAPCHIIDVTANASSSVQQEQSKFVSQERGDILPLQRRHVAQPSVWKKSTCFRSHVGFFFAIKWCA